MKPRPRRVESEVAKRLSLFLSHFGAESVYRIPILGRTGPDIEIDPIFQFVIDVKSRKEVPKTYILKKSEVRQFGMLLAFRLENLHLGQFEKVVVEPEVFSSVVVDRWWSHMHEWTRDHRPSGITALVLHRPGLDIDHSTFVIHISDWRIFHERYRNADRARAERRYDQGLPAGG